MSNTRRRSSEHPKSGLEEIEQITSYTPVSTKQTLVYVAIVLGCFAVVYPRMIHPMVKVALGLNEVPKEVKPEFPPQHLNRGKPMPGSGPGMRPPPGARGETGIPESKGSGGTIMGMVLPLYAGGIFLYLMYAASKAYKSDGSKKKKKDSQEEVYSLITERLAGLDLEKILTGEDTDGAAEINKLADILRKKKASPKQRDIDGECDEDESVEVIENTDADPSIRKSTASNPKTRSKGSRADADVSHVDDTDELLRKCENSEHMTEEEMLRLKNRLSEVEGRMNKLMSAIQTVQSKTTNVASELDEATENFADRSDKESHEGEDGERINDEEEDDDLSSLDYDDLDQYEVRDTNPDYEMLDPDRYEVGDIDDGLGESSGEEGDPRDVESAGMRKRTVDTEGFIGYDDDEASDSS